MRGQPDRRLEQTDELKGRKSGCLAQLFQVKRPGVPFPYQIDNHAENSPVARGLLDALTATSMALKQPTERADQKFTRPEETTAVFESPVE